MITSVDIVSQPLARVLQEESLTGPRGPDGCHEVTVLESWFSEESWIEVSLPRLLRCASCEGGGCDQCERSGAIATRPRKSPEEILEIQLPRGGPATLRLPQRGGVPLEGQDVLVRGLLLLTIRVGEVPSEGLRRRTSIVDIQKSPRLNSNVSRPGTAQSLLWLGLFVGAGIILLILWWSTR